MRHRTIALPPLAQRARQTLFRAPMTYAMELGHAHIQPQMVLLAMMEIPAHPMTVVLGKVAVEIGHVVA